MLSNAVDARSASVYTGPEAKTAGRSIINEKNINGFGTFHGSQRKLLCGRCVRSVCYGGKNGGRAGGCTDWQHRV